MLFSFGNHKGFNIHIYNLSYSHTNNLALLLIIHIVVNPIICTECDSKSNDKLNPFPPITVEIQLSVPNVIINLMINLTPSLPPQL